MSTITKQEKDIVEFLQKEFNPEVIVLVGSRAQGHAQAGSDWDLYVYSNVPHIQGRFVGFRSQTLDITLLPSEHLKRQIIRNNFSPITSTCLRVLYDRSHGEFSKLLKRTQVAFDEGPLSLWRGDFEDRVLTLRRQVDKMERYKDNADVQFIYAGAFYEFVPQVYFERRNMWTPPPVASFKFFDEYDAKFLGLLRNLRWSKGAGTSRTAQQILTHIEEP